MPRDRTERSVSLGGATWAILNARPNLPLAGEGQVHIATLGKVKTDREKLRRGDSLF